MEGKRDRGRLARARGLRLVGTLPARAQDAPQRVSLALLGSFALQTSSCLLGPLPKKAQALLAYLAIQGQRPVPREEVAALLWGHTGTEQARRSLRQCLMSVRTALRSKAALTNDPNGVVLTLPSEMEVDVHRFEILARSSKLEEISKVAKSIHNVERSQAEKIKAGKRLWEQLDFDGYLAKRETEPSYSLRRHLRERGGAVEE